MIVVRARIPQSTISMIPKRIAMVFFIAISFYPAYAETEQVQNWADGFFNWVGSSIKSFVGDDIPEHQTERINETIDSGVNAGSIAVLMWRTFHHFVVNAILLLASALGVEIGETIAFVIGVVITLFIAGMLLKKFVFESWKIVLALLAVLAVLLFTGFVFIEA